MSLENPNQDSENPPFQCDNVFSLGNIFTVHFTNDTLTNPENLDMSLLIDLSSSTQAELPLNASVVSADDLNNNPSELCLQNKFVVADNETAENFNSQPLQIGDSYTSCNLDESSVNRNETTVSDDDISEFLIFHKKRDVNNDPKLKYGCYVKLEDYFIAPGKLNTLEVQRDRRRKRKLETNPTPPVVKKAKHKQPTSKRRSRDKRCKHKESSRVTLISSTKETKLNSSVINPIPVNAQPKIILRFVREKDSKYQCQILNQIENQFPIRNCTVLMERLPTINSSVSLNCGEKNLFKMENDITPINNPKKRNFAIEERAKDKPISLFNDIEPLHLPTTKTNQRVQRIQIDSESIANESIWSRSENKNFDLNQVNNDLNNESSDIEHLAHSNEITCPIVNESCSQEGKLNGCSGVSPKNTFTCKNEDANWDSDDNCSVSSGISIYAPSLSELASPNRDDSIDEMLKTTNENLGGHRKKYRIPKLIKVAETQSAVSKQLPDLTMDEQVKEIFSLTINNSPELLSPIQDLNLSLIRLKSKKNHKRPEKNVQDESVAPSAIINKKSISVSKKTDSKDNKLQLKRETSAIKPTGIGEPCLPPKRSKSEKSSSNGIDQSKELCHSKVQSENGVVLKETSEELRHLEVPLENGPKAITNTSESSGVRTNYQSSIDFRNMEKLIINVADRNSVRSVSLSADRPSVMATHLQSTAATSEAVAIVPGTQQTLHNSMPPTYHLQPTLQDTLRFPHKPSEPSIPQPIDSVQQHSSIAASSPMNLSRDKMKRSMKNNEILMLFQRPCFNFLKGTPCRFPAPCQFNHMLPSNESIFEKMSTFPDDTILFIYREFIVKYQSTFSQYFPIICQLFGLRKMCKALESVVQDCDNMKRYDFFEFIFRGLKLCNKTSSEALELITDCLESICKESHEAIFKIAKENP